MPTLYIQEQGVMVRKRDNQVLITKDGQTLSEVPLAKIDQVVLMGRGVQLSTALLIDLLERGIPVTFTNQHGSRVARIASAGVGIRRARLLPAARPDQRHALIRVYAGAP
jgi:CRISPR-associated protein Cas1